MSLAELLLRHLRRLAWWSWAAAAVGVLIALGLSSSEFWRSLGWMSAGWSAVNLAIVMGSRRSRKPVERRSLREFLFLNLGLNVAYIGVGVCLAWLGPPGVAGSGWAVAVHGAALLALDGWLLSEVPPQDATPEP